MDSFLMIEYQTKVRIKLISELIFNKRSQTINIAGNCGGIALKIK